ncbi:MULTISPECIES: PaaI family thioesterase [Spirosoma]|uniref:PaaI family thioesterase n=2 Tax=Spirosoma TaxID=107 RepID=A0A6G9ANJ7_9BACT|nr:MULTISPECIES: PaaI family thioesterase [Spirosoma]QHV94709.1 hotdog fold thioesterase [Spirosoma endbachense]QIP14037.1 PaaI family thioesterase [Spirosoma aureum]
MDNLTNPRLDFFRSQIGNDMSGSISPFGRWLKGTIRAADYGRLVVEYTIREELTNPAGVLHGGAAAGILDDLVGATVFTLGREYAYTSVNLNIDFLHAARLGESITAIAEVIREGKNIIHGEGRIVAADGKIIAKCATNLIQTSMKLPI